MDRQSLLKVKQNLSNFAEFSGLNCNFEKSAVMCTENPTPEELLTITEAGFSSTNHIKLLGMEITSALDNKEEIFEVLINKISNLVSYWDRFKLTLPGRITVAKTFLVSQLNYVGCFLVPSQATLDRIQLIINTYVKGNINISQSRIQTRVEDGGLGMFNLKDFLSAQMCSWIGRAYRNQIDNWRYDLKLAAPGNNISLIRPCDLDPDLNPILHGIVCAYREFYSHFTKCNKNWRQAIIFDN
jgi:hypothetical protein